MDEAALKLLDGLADHLCVLDAEGRISFVNRAWRQFARANPPPAREADVGADYFAVCEAAQGDDAGVAREALAGLRAVARGDVAEFTLEYPCHAPHVKRWFELRATRVPDEAAARLVLVHRDVTAGRMAEDHLVRAQETLRTLAARLQSVREDERGHLSRWLHDEIGHALTSLKVDLSWTDRHLEHSKASGRTRVRRRLAAANQLIDRMAESLRRMATQLRPAILDALGRDSTGERAADTSTPVGEQLGHLSLSARELQVLRLTVAGHTGKAIAAELDLSPKTVSTYRTRILQKLRLPSVAELVRYADRHGLA